MEGVKGVTFGESVEIPELVVGFEISIALKLQGYGSMRIRGVLIRYLDQEYMHEVDENGFGVKFMEG
jgi:hypothetical protein